MSGFSLDWREYQCVPVAAIQLVPAERSLAAESPFRWPA